MCDTGDKNARLINTGHKSVTAMTIIGISVDKIPIFGINFDKIMQKPAQEKIYKSIHSTSRKNPTETPQIAMEQTANTAAKTSPLV